MLAVERTRDMENADKTSVEMSDYPEFQKEVDDMVEIGDNIRRAGSKRIIEDAAEEDIGMNGIEQGDDAPTPKKVRDSRTWPRGPWQGFSCQHMPKLPTMLAAGKCLGAILPDPAWLLTLIEAACSGAHHIRSACLLPIPPGEFNAHAHV